MLTAKNVTILISAYNEEDVIKPLYERLTVLASKLGKYNFEFLFVNDGSSDKTLDIVQDLAATDKRIAYINLSTNFGKEVAMAAGFDHATGDAVVSMDADLQDPPELIPEMIHHWEKGFDDVYARRSSRKGESFLKQVTSKIFYRLLRNVNLPL